jgi:hypothetical protein
MDRSFVHCWTVLRAKCAITQRVSDCKQKPVDLRPVERHAVRELLETVSKWVSQLPAGGVRDAFERIRRAAASLLGLVPLPVRRARRRRGSRGGRVR